MKTNTEYKNAALAALKGNWAKAVLASVVYIAIMFVAIGPYMFYTAKMQAYRMENMPTAPGSLSSALGSAMALLQDPEYMALSQKASGWNAVYWLMFVFVMLPMMLGFANAFLRLLTGGENDILGNTYKIATKNYWHKMWGMFLMHYFHSFFGRLPFHHPRNYQDVLLCDDALYPGRESGIVRERSHRPQPRDDEGPQVRSLLAVAEFHRLAHPEPSHAGYRRPLAGPVPADGHRGFL
jgi:hypothetical protein